MLFVISPAKRLDFEPQALCTTTTRPELLTQSKQLIAQLRELSPKQVGKLMGISDKLSVDVHGYFAHWKAKFDTVRAKQAVLAFRGDVYQALDADSFTAEDFDFAQQRLRILSGLYGVLRPLDLIQAYRLEMGTKLAGNHGKDLYAFWGQRLADSLSKALTEQGDNVLVNLASNEYFRAAQAKRLGCRVITPVFKDRQGSDYKQISFFAKQARGMMAGQIIRKQITVESDLLKFRMAGYQYHRGLSSEGKPVFTRDRPPHV
jgi:cytoplasmic iron level regulating protein YaaA (DUF328/UPF0246 family)